MDHRSGDKGKGVATEGKRISLADNYAAMSEIRSEKALHHSERLGGGDYRSLGIGVKEIDDICGMVRLHMLYHKVIRLTAFKRLADIIQPFTGKRCVDRIHNGDPFIDYGVRVI